MARVHLEAAPELGFVEPKPQHVAVAEALRLAIALGRFAPGDRLPPERDLAASLGVGRMTLRQGIRLLNEEGLVRTSRGRTGGSVVAETRQPVVGTSDLILSANERIRENYEFRLSVEPVAARLCAQRATKAQLKTIAELAEATPESLARYRALDSRFHLAIGEACGNGLILDGVRRARADFFIWADAVWILSETLSEETETSGEQHRAIANAVVKGDPVRAERNMTTHLEWSYSSFAARLPLGRSPVTRSTGSRRSPR
jgi:GntR family transcriptional repressor for pyruvate dehydrogenase complex